MLVILISFLTAKVIWAHAIDEDEAETCFMNGELCKPAGNPSKRSEACLHHSTPGLQQVINSSCKQ